MRRVSIATAGTNPGSRARIGESGLRPIGSTPEQFTAFIERGYAFFEKAMGSAEIEAR